MDEVSAEPLEGLPQTLAEVIAAKAEDRKQRAALPWPEKVRIVVELQKRTAPILAARGIRARIWNLDEVDEVRDPVD